MKTLRFLTRPLAAVVLAAAIPWTTPHAMAGRLAGVKTVFVILMENHDWADIKGSTNCPCINGTLLPMASSCEQYYNPPGLHPSEPNYIWLESGTNFGILNDQPTNRINSTNHLVTLLARSGISWRTYAEDIEPGYCPVTNRLNYRVRHTPQVLFTDVSTNEAYCANHVVPYQQLWADLSNNTVARYNFLVPSLTNDMHNAPCTACSGRVAGDYWLSHEIPRILASPAYTNGGAIFITWDEGAGTSDGPIGMIVLSPLAKGHGYSNAIRYTHSSFVRTMQDIFGVRPYLHDAANAVNLSDLFRGPLRLVSAQYLTNGWFRFTVTNAVARSTNHIQASTDLRAWSTVGAKVPAGTAFTFTDTQATNAAHRFYRVLEVP
jgi:hypothetical protein